MTPLLDHCPSSDSIVAMMIGGAELVVILLVIVIPVVIGVVVVLAVMAGKKRNVPPPPDVQAEIEGSLMKIDSLLAAGKISQAEHEQQRKQILDRL